MRRRKEGCFTQRLARFHCQKLTLPQYEPSLQTGDLVQLIIEEQPLEVRKYQNLLEKSQMGRSPDFGLDLSNKSSVLFQGRFGGRITKRESSCNGNERASKKIKAWRIGEDFLIRSLIPHILFCCANEDSFRLRTFHMCPNLFAYPKNASFRTSLFQSPVLLCFFCY